MIPAQIHPNNTWETMNYLKMNTEKRNIEKYSDMNFWKYIYILICRLNFGKNISVHVLCVYKWIKIY